MAKTIEKTLLYGLLSWAAAYYVGCACGSSSSSSTTDTTPLSVDVGDSSNDITDLQPGAQLTATNKIHTLSGTCTTNVTDVQASLNGADFSQVTGDFDCSDSSWSATFTLIVGVNDIIFRFFTAADTYSEVLIQVTLQTHLRRWYLQSDGDDFVSALTETVSNDATGGSIIVAGQTGGSGNLDISSDTQLDTSGSPGDGFLVRYNRTGGTVAANARFTGPGTMNIPDVKLLNDGTMVIAGSISGNDAGAEIDVDPNTGNQPIDTENDSEDGIIVKLSAAGAYDWHVHLHSAADDRVMTVDTLANGNLIVAGCVSENNVEFAPNNPTQEYTTYGGGISGENIFLAVYEPDSGNWVSHNVIESAGGDSCIMDSVKDSNGAISFVGYFTGASVDFDFGGTDSLQSSNGGKDYFILKVNSAGEFVSVVTHGGSADEQLDSAAVDLNGDLYFGGQFVSSPFNPSFAAGGTNLINSGSRSGFLMKVSGSSFVWGVGFEAPSSQFNEVEAIAVDPSGRSYVSIITNSDIDVDPGADSVVYSHSGNESTALVYLGTNGEYISHYTQATDNILKINALHYSTNRSFLMGGEFKGSSTDFEFGPGEVTQSSNSGTSDGFLIEINY